MAYQRDKDQGSLDEMSTSDALGAESADRNPRSLGGCSPLRAWLGRSRLRGSGSGDVPLCVSSRLCRPHLRGGCAGYRSDGMTVFQMGEQRLGEVASFPWGCPARLWHACPSARSVPAHSAARTLSDRINDDLSEVSALSGAPRASLQGSDKGSTCHRRGRHPHSGSAAPVSLPDARPAPPPPPAGVSGQSQRRAPCASGTPCCPGRAVSPALASPTPTGCGLSFHPESGRK